MATPGKAPSPATLGAFSAHDCPETQNLLELMLLQYAQLSDIILSPGRVPQVEVHGQLLAAENIFPLTADDTRRIAADLISDNKQAVAALREQGFCDVSYALPKVARFRANIFIQRGSCAIVMRMIPTSIPEFHNLGIPEHLGEIASLRDGIVLVTGGRGSGKSCTLAALVDQINEQQTCHILTIEDPIEFLHNHKRATIHQRELHSDTPTFPLALRAALRQAPRVIFVGEIRDRETMELVLQAAETGHLVLSSLNTVDASKTIDRVARLFPSADHSAIRGRLAKTLRYVIAQRLLPLRGGNGRAAVFEIFKMTARSLEYVECEDYSGRTLLEAIKAGSADGMQHFDGEIEKLVHAGRVDEEIALSYASDPAELRASLRNSSS
jgi:twitching motility protein PilT